MLRDQSLQEASRTSSWRKTWLALAAMLILSGNLFA